MVSAGSATLRLALLQLVPQFHYFARVTSGLLGINILKEPTSALLLLLYLKFYDINVIILLNIFSRNERQSLMLTRTTEFKDYYSLKIFVTSITHYIIN